MDLFTYMGQPISLCLIFDVQSKGAIPDDTLALRSTWACVLGC